VKLNGVGRKSGLSWDQVRGRAWRLSVRAMIWQALRGCLLGSVNFSPAEALGRRGFMFQSANSS
jgi:hypothetical protein